MTSSSKLEILKNSLARKEAEFASKLDAHFEDVRSANGQPLNDKRNGAATMSRWERQNDGLRSLKASIEKTKTAIDREQSKVDLVNSLEIPAALRAMVDAGELSQWRKHPNTFFVKGVEKGRIVWNAESNNIGCRYASEIPADQYAQFRDAFYKVRAMLKGDSNGDMGLHSK